MIRATALRKAVFTHSQYRFPVFSRLGWAGRIGDVHFMRIGFSKHSFTSTSSLSPGKMAPRRSARLSEAATDKAAVKEDSPSSAVAPPRTSRKRKAPSSSTKEAEPNTSSPAAEEPSPPSLPMTPQKRRKAPTASAAAAAPPATPTPNAIGLMSEPGRAAAAPTTPRHRAVTRVADPRATNAQLLSPETSRVVASRPVDDQISPSKAKGTTTTTATLLSEACAHLVKVDPRMKRLIDAHHCHVFSPEGLSEQIDPFESLASGIISQQVSGAAARSIKTKFVALFHDDEDEDDEGNRATTAAESDSGEEEKRKKKKRFPHPSQVAASPLERLRTAGLSQRKAEYIQGLAQKFASSELTAQMLADAPYEDVLERLTAVRGLGRWSVEMFACFALKRMDVFSLGDLGVQRGMAAFAGRDVAKLKTSKGGKWKYMSEKDMVEMSDRFAPYRSLFMWYMWRVEETDVSTLE